MRGVLVASLSVSLAVACTYSSVYSSLSSPATVGESIKYSVHTTCGLDAMPFDIDGSMWAPVRIEPSDRAATPEGFAADQDDGTLTLISEELAEYKTSMGRVIPLRRLPGDFETEDC